MILVLWTAWNTKRQIDNKLTQLKSLQGYILHKKYLVHEFGPGYCTNCNNCGEKFFLLEKNGDIYSCVRGQKNPDYYYGNIYINTVDEILNTARNKMPESFCIDFSEICLFKNLPKIIAI